ncbi:AMIN domain-containing protein [Microseira wollei]|uniref:Type II and III secretion system protein n=1 Tax=Microseira wollei NIES-4236 TaxID=2530354 RepID=A0AAV3XN68_9CYAN|nr:AMIN domain-containing protein [Microseira wollei]GET43758.1 type II and III secretion system protein [Microseira wollei NIES-4236]
MKQHQGLGALLIGGGVLLATQPVWAAATQVTGVRVNPNGNGVQVVLETRDGDRPQIFMINRRNDLVADITNTQLRLPQGNSFRQDNPAPGIAAVTITQMNANSIRVTVSGTNGVPKGQIIDRPGGGGIALNFSSAGGGAAAAPTQTTPTQGNSPTAQVPTAQPPTGQTPLVPNPQININGQPAPPAGTIQPTSPTPPFLPRAVAPPVGDIAVSEADTSASTIDLGTAERIPRLLLRDAPVREVLSLLARAANLNIAFVKPTPTGGQAQAQGQAQGLGLLDSTISLDIENESIQDVFNYVLRITRLEANREGRTIFVGTRLPDQARNVISRTLRLNQVLALDATRFLIEQGAERNEVRTTTQVITIGEGATARTVTTTQTQVELVTADELNDQGQTSYKGNANLPLRGVLVTPNERVNTVTIVGDPRKIELASALISQLDARRRQVAVNVKIIDVNLLNTDLANTSFSFGVGRAFFSIDGGAAYFNYGGFRPPQAGEAAGSLVSPTVIPNPIQGTPFLDPNSPILVPGTTPGRVDVGADGSINIQPNQPGAFPRPVAPFGTGGNPLVGGITEVQPATPTTVTTTITPGTPGTPATPDRTTPDRFITQPDGTVTVIPGQFIPGTPGTPPTPPTTTRTVNVGQPGSITTALPSLFQFPTRFLSLLQAQITNNNAKILTDPTLLIQEGETASVNLGQEVVTNRIIQRENTNAGQTVTERVEKGNAGLTLQIQVSRIDDNGFITMTVNPSITAPSGVANIAGGSQITLLARRDLQSGQIRIRDGQTLILSGIIQDSDRTSITKVPILGDIPILGALFRRTERSNARQEVIVLLTPQVLDDASGAPFGYRYRPSPDVQQMLQQRGGIPGVNNR